MLPAVLRVVRVGAQPTRRSGMEAGRRGLTREPVQIIEGVCLDRDIEKQAAAVQAYRAWLGPIIERTSRRRSRENSLYDDIPEAEGRRVVGDRIHRHFWTQRVREEPRVGPHCNVHAHGGKTQETSCLVFNESK